MLHLEPEPDETCAPDDTASVRGVPTLYFRDASRSILSSNTSPDVPFNRSVNPYRGCEHGCIYCYARPTHEYLGLSAGLDFETRIFVKPRAPELLRAELSRRSWTPQVLAMSGVTDPYQPIERRLQLTRGCLAVLAECRNPVGVITKSALVTRDLDLLAELATHRCVRALLHESSLARTMPTDRILTGRCDTTLVGRGRSSDSGSHSRGRPHSPAQLDSGREGHRR